MKNRKSIYGIAIVSILFLVLAGCSHRRWNAEQFTNHVLERLDDQADDLELTEEQTVKYQQIRAKLETDLAKAHLNHETAWIALHETINQESPEITSLTGIFRTQLNNAPKDLGIFWTDLRSSIPSSTRSKKPRC